MVVVSVAEVGVVVAVLGFGLGSWVKLTPCLPATVIGTTEEVAVLLVEERAQPDSNEF